MVERHLAKVEVAGSSPVIRSKDLVRKDEIFLFRSGQGLLTRQEPQGGSAGSSVHLCVESRRLDTLGSSFSQRGTSLRPKQLSTVFGLLSPQSAPKISFERTRFFFFGADRGCSHAKNRRAVLRVLPSTCVSKAVASIRSACLSRNVGHRFAKNSYQLFSVCSPVIRGI